MKTTGTVGGVSKYVPQFIENVLRGRIVTTHPYGHGIGRAIENIWNLHPGRVIQYLATNAKTRPQD